MYKTHQSASIKKRIILLNFHPVISIETNVMRASLSIPPGEGIMGRMEPLYVLLLQTCGGFQEREEFHHEHVLLLEICGDFFLP